MSKWVEIAERCEKATGPDREIDAEIEASVTGRVTHKDAVGWTMEPQGEDWKLRQLANAPYISAAKRPAPCYTASLDAITALIERELPGCGWEIDRSPFDARIAGRLVTPRARVQQRGDMLTYEGWPACSGVTPALALCAAFCRAMLSEAMRGARA